MAKKGKGDGAGASAAVAEKKKGVIGHDPTVDAFGQIGYWAGTTDDCPRQNVTIRGITFQRFTEKIFQPKGAMKTQRSRHRGGLQKLTPEQEVELRKAVMDKVFLPSPGAPIRDRSDFANPSRLRSVGEFVYLIPMSEVTNLAGPNWNDPTSEASIPTIAQQQNSKS